MTVRTRLHRALTDEERQALSSYGSEARFFHAVAQQWESDLHHDPEYNAFWPRCGALTDALDTAIAASELVDPATLFSAHGNGFGVRGALEGLPEQFVGLTYRYPGFISTTSDPGFRDSFLDKRNKPNSRATVLEFQLPAEFRAMDMHNGGHAGEFEFLLGRNTRFGVTNAAENSGVLWLILAPLDP